jgi:hypothetical protein
MKEQYYYVWQNHKGEVRFFGDGLSELPIEYKYIGKIKLEVKDEEANGFPSAQEMAHQATSKALQ